MMSNEIEPMWTSPEDGHTFIAGLWRVTRTPMSGYPDTPITSYELVTTDADALTQANARVEALVRENRALKAALEDISNRASTEQPTGNPDYAIATLTTRETNVAYSQYNDGHDKGMWEAAEIARKSLRNRIGLLRRTLGDIAEGSFSIIYSPEEVAQMALNQDDREHTAAQERAANAGDTNESGKEDSQG